MFMQEFQVADCIWMPKNPFSVSVTSLPEKAQPQPNYLAAEKPLKSSSKQLHPSKEVVKTETFKTLFKASKFSPKEI